MQPRSFKMGMEITLDTHIELFIQRKVDELINFEHVQSMVFEESPEFRLLRRLLKRIASLHLIDPYASDLPQRLRFGS